MPHRRSRAAALVAVIALLLAAPFERGRGCDVCPVDCPMHRAAMAPARHVGCHQGLPDAGPAAERHAGADDACAMRSSCGHHGRAELSVFRAELTPREDWRPVVVARPVARAVVRVATADAPAPLEHPPEPLFV